MKDRVVLAVAFPLVPIVFSVLLLSVIAGPTPRLPLALETPGATFAEVARTNLRGIRVAPVSYTHLTLPTIYSV